MDKYTTVKTIGDGTYGSVLKAMNKRTGEIVAIKKMKKKYYKWNACVDQKEIESLIKLSHPNIVQLYEVILEKNTLHFVFEYLD
jgi:male germ cell-associated kinase